MAHHTFKDYERQLLELRERLREEIQDRVETVPEQMQAQGDVTHLPTHKADQDVEGLDAEVASGEAQHVTLAAVNAALKRIEEGRFGKCLSCGQEIAKDRLQAIPYTAYCIECERQHESEEAR